MAAAEGLLYALERNWDMVDAALADLDQANLARIPADQCNSVAWILWHMDRVVDTFIHTRLRSISQIWVAEGWHQKYGMSGDPEDRGVGWTAEQVASWAAAPRDAQLGYYEAIKNAARAYMGSLSDAEMEVTLVIPPVPESRSVAQGLGQMTWDNIAHGGQIAYLRGLYLGMGWHR